MLELFPAIFLFALGLCVGSFMNVLILRFGFNERPMARSECAQCGTAIYWYDLMPVLSYIILQGRCRTCGSSLNHQYPIVEILTGLLFVLSFEVYEPSLTISSFITFFALLLFWSASLAIAVYDVKHTLIPMPFVWAIVIAAVIIRLVEAYIVMDMYPLIDGAMSAILLGGFFALVTFITQGRGMGIGDAYIAAAIGVLLGLLRGIEAVVLGVWAATIIYLALLLFSYLRLSPSGVRVTMKTELPFAPWLFLGTALAMFTNLSPLETIQRVMDSLFLF